MTTIFLLAPGALTMSSVVTSADATDRKYALIFYFDAVNMQAKLRDICEYELDPQQFSTMLPINGVDWYFIDGKRQSRVMIHELRAIADTRGKPDEVYCNQAGDCDYFRDICKIRNWLGMIEILTVPRLLVSFTGGHRDYPVKPTPGCTCF